jgi:hypothetical protein
MFFYQGRVDGVCLADDGGRNIFCNPETGRRSQRQRSSRTAAGELFHIYSTTTPGVQSKYC